VIVVDMNSNVAYATGGVSRSGVYQLTRKTTLLQFISMFGGFNEFAKIRKAFIVRGEKKIDLKLKKLIKRKELKYNIVIQKGDVLVVPE
jgi:protein involved in polysaccharide export with SLBB domain